MALSLCHVASRLSAPIRVQAWSRRPLKTDRTPLLQPTEVQTKGELSAHNDPLTLEALFSIWTPATQQKWMEW